MPQNNFKFSLSFNVEKSLRIFAIKLKQCQIEWNNAKQAKNESSIFQLLQQQPAAVGKADLVHRSTAKNHFISLAIFNHVLSAVRETRQTDRKERRFVCNVSMQHEGAATTTVTATTATIAAYNFVCAQTKAETTWLNAAQTRVESSGSNNLPYHVQIKNVKCASIWCKHRNVQCPITKQNENYRNSTAAAQRTRDQRTTGRMKHIFFLRVWRVSTSIYANLLPPNELIQNIYLLLCSNIHHKRFKTPSKASVNEFRLYIYFFCSMSAAARFAFVSWHRTSFTIFTYKVFIIRYL